VFLDISLPHDVAPICWILASFSAFRSSYRQIANFSDLESAAEFRMFNILTTHFWWCCNNVQSLSMLQWAKTADHQGPNVSGFGIVNESCQLFDLAERFLNWRSSFNSNFKQIDHYFNELCLNRQLPDNSEFKTVTRLPDLWLIPNPLFDSATLPY